MRVAIVGSRNYPDAEQVRAYVRSLPQPTEVVSGGANGVDSWAEEAARAAGIRVTVYYPDWALHGRSAGFRRNHTIVENCDRLVAFMVAGGSRGTQHSIDLAHRAGKPVEVFQPQEEKASE